VEGDQEDRGEADRGEEDLGPLQPGVKMERGRKGGSEEEQGRKRGRKDIFESNDVCLSFPFRMKDVFCSVNGSNPIRRGHEIGGKPLESYN
jgi:hypothetical protein